MEGTGHKLENNGTSLAEAVEYVVNWLVIPFVGFVVYLWSKLTRLEVIMERTLTQIDERQRFYIEERKEQQAERDRTRIEHLEVNRELRDAINKLNQRLDVLASRSQNGGGQ